MSNLKGINILGYIHKQFGLGEAVRSNIRSIKSVNIPHVINDFKFEISPDIKEEHNNSFEIIDENPYSVNLIQINFDNFSKVISSTNKNYLKGKYNIGFWAWELNYFPSNFQNYIEILDEIWVPSNFCQNAIAHVSNKPVLRFMHSIETPSTQLSREELNLPKDKFIFLTMFDYHSVLERKNPYATISAFEKAFGENNTQAVLIIKTSVGDNFKDMKDKLKNRIKTNSAIILIEEILPRESLDALINNCDAFVSLHRSEGFGLTLAEAMSLGKPVIATAYSGNLDFMNFENSCLVPYQLISTDNNYVYTENAETHWADPDVDYASKVMLKLFKEQDFRTCIGEKARNEVKYLLDPQNIGLAIKNRLDYIYQFCVPKIKIDINQTVFNLQQENSILTTKLAALKRTKVVKWKLKFKNITNKIFGKNKTYIWEE
ncbi:glycosyltransferase [Sphingobacterium multivorum]|uniref:glycosyltransferase n=1 Tax=Sphingobacterium multivorum TaxID=28454 RepID=UPI000E003E78|nr:glycosyltransferase [Sphingobacterium multivorum]QQT42828.1 glycosyltransferase [Sphingobacterium multivorum]SUJ02182.1 Capsular polysaccharide biosynthesis protein [Sphingobacterium multivorum]HBI89917.1 glycosyl transferase family 2 [Sphingobacterium sp.]